MVVQISVNGVSDRNIFGGSFIITLKESDKYEE